MTNQETDVKRAASRFVAGLPAVLHLPGGEKSCQAYNLSRSGVLLRVDLAEPGAPRLRVTLHTPGRDLELTLTGEVARFERGEDGEYLIGLAFAGLGPQEVETLDRLVARVVEGMAPAALGGLDPDASGEEIDRALEMISLPHRIALAARGSLKERSFLMRDSNPKVLEALVRNPNTSLRELKALARVPHLLASTLAMLATDRRAAADLDLKCIIASHPRISTKTAEEIVAALDEKGLRWMAQQGAVHSSVRARLTAKLSRLARARK
jgi:hypothetical protein